MEKISSISLKNASVLLIIFSFLVLSGQVKKITVDDTPSNPKFNVKLTELFTIGEDNGEDKPVILQVGRFEVDKDNKIVVADNADMSIKIFDKNGKYVKSFGKKGQGPGEFNMITDITTNGKGFLVNDAMSRSISSFSPEGKFIKSYSFTKEIPASIPFAHDTVFYSFAVIVGEDFQTTQTMKEVYCQFSLSGKILKTYFKRDRKQPRKFDKGKLSIDNSVVDNYIFSIENKDFPLFVASSNNYVINSFKITGEPILEITKKFKRVKYTDKELDSIKTETNERVKAYSAQFQIDIKYPDFKRAIGSIDIDSKGLLWISTSEIKIVNGKSCTVYEILTKEGKFINKIWLEIQPISELKFVGDRLYVAIKDPETELDVLKCYKVEIKQ